MTDTIIPQLHSPAVKVFGPAPVEGGRQVYRAYTKHNTLLYIGSASDTRKRLKQHATSTAWYSLAARVVVENYPTRAAGFAAENAAISAEGPVFQYGGHVSSRDIEVMEWLVRDYYRNRAPGHSYAFVVEAARTAREVNDKLKPLQNTIDRTFDWLEKGKKLWMRFLLVSSPGFLPRSVTCVTDLRALGG